MVRGCQTVRRPFLLRSSILRRPRRARPYGVRVALRGVVGYVLVVLGGLVLAVLPASSAVAQDPWIGGLRSSTPGRLAAVAVVVVGLALAASAWLELVRYAGRGDRLDVKDRMTLVRQATVFWCLPLLLAPPMFSQDAWSYAAQGAMTHLGLSPYVWGPSVLNGPIIEAVDPRWLDTPTPYGPIPLVWGALAAHFTNDPWLLVVAHRLLSVLGLVLLAYAVPRLASWAGRDPARASALVVASPLVLAHGIAGAHNDVAMAGVMALALVVAVERSWVAGALLAGLAAAVKVPAGFVGIGIALVSLPTLVTRAERVWRLVVVAVLALGTLVLVGAATGLGVGWVHGLAVPGDVKTPFSVTTQLGQLVGLMLEPLHIGVTVDGAVAVARLLGSVLAVVVAARIALRAPTGVPAAGVRATALAMLVVLALSLAVHPWYLLWCLPFLVASHLDRRSDAVLLHLSWFLGLVAPLGSLGGAVTAVILAVLLIGGVAARQLLSHRSTSTAPREAVAVVERFTP